MMSANDEKYLKLALRSAIRTNLNLPIKEVTEEDKTESYEWERLIKKLSNKKI